MPACGHELEDALAQFVIADGGDERDRSARRRGRRGRVERVARAREPQRLGLAQGLARGQLDEHLAQHEHVEFRFVGAGHGHH